MPLDGDQYPVNLVLTGRRCLVVGGGPVALRKATGLVACGAAVHMIATVFSPELDGLPVTVEARPYRPGDLAGYRLVIAATDDHDLNQDIYREAEAAGVWVNCADDPAACSFTLPSVVRQGPVMVTVSTGGHSPALSAWLKQQIEGWLGPEYQAMADLLSSARDELRAAGRSTERADWRILLDSDMLELIRTGRIDLARERLQSWLSSSSG